MHTFSMFCKATKKRKKKKKLWRSSSEVVPGLGHVLFSHGDGWESGSETDVHESCQTLPVTNATSPP